MGSKKVFLAQHAGAAFMSNADVPESQWKTLSRHTTRLAAQRQVDKHRRQDRRYNGPNAWSDMYRIVEQ